MKLVEIYATFSMTNAEIDERIQLAEEDQE